VSNSDDTFGVITDISSFYYESGGQIFDTGALVTSNNVVFQVTNTQTYAGYVVHSGAIKSGSLRVGDEVTCQVDYSRRSYIAPNHTMTHVLNYALRTVLIDSSKDAANLLAAGLCEQKGTHLPT
jgi:alanyl-tRNA synthetase